MEVIRTDDFESMLLRLPVTTRKTVERQLLRFIENRRHPSLQTKKLLDMDGVNSIRVGRSHRALFFFIDNTCAVFFAIGHRKDIYK